LKIKAFFEHKLLITTIRLHFLPCGGHTTHSKRLCISFKPESNTVIVSACCDGPAAPTAATQAS
jgi:hypothetical protein